jgi:L-asparaginase II
MFTRYVHVTQKQRFLKAPWAQNRACVTGDCMENAVKMVEIIRGGRVESSHMGHAVICNGAGDVIRSWGNPDAVIFPRSSCKMIQALPLLESGVGRDLTPAHLAMVCASHQGAAVHTEFVARWLADLGLAEGDLRCGAHEPSDIPARDGLIRAGDAPCQIHNNCSGKHTGFLMMTQGLKAGPEYVDPDHPLQQAILTVTNEVTGEASPGYGIDGCSAPNHACSVHGLARAMGAFATATDTGDARQRAMHRLTQAMYAHPDLVAGETRACTELMRAVHVPVALKTGAEAVYTAILPTLGLGIAVKIADGGFRASEAFITGLLAHLGVLDANHPAALKRLGGPTHNWRGMETGMVQLVDGVI